MEVEIPDRIFTKEEVNRCYLKWQQLRNLHGENAPKIPEFIMCTRILQKAAKQQQDAKLQQQNAVQNNTQFDQSNDPRESVSIAGSPKAGNLPPIQPVNSRKQSEVSKVPPNQGNNQAPQLVDGMQNQLSPGQQYQNALDQHHGGEQEFQAQPRAQLLPENEKAQMEAELQQSGSGQQDGPFYNQHMPQQSPPSIQPNYKPTLSNTEKEPNGLSNNYNNSNPSQRGTPMSAGSPQQRPHPASIFTHEQSTLLKAQITALKCLVNQQQVPRECQVVIQQSIERPPDFKRMLMSLSEFVKRQHFERQNGQKHEGPNVAGATQHVGNNPNATNTQQSIINDKKPSPTEEQGENPNPSIIKQELSQTIENQQNTQTTTNEATDLSLPDRVDTTKMEQQKEKILDLGKSATPKENIPPGLIDKRRSRTLSNQDDLSPKSITSEEIRDARKSSVKENELPQSPPFEGEKEPPQQAAPILLEEFKLLHKEIKEVVNVTDPSMIVDAFSLPNMETKVDYEKLFPTSETSKQEIYPGLLPTGLDVHSATELYHTLTALNIGTTIDAFLNDIVSDKTDEETRCNSLYDYYALQLLPLQKAVRGHVLQFEWYQNSLLPNTHPNFLSKVRNINMLDTIFTRELYRRHELVPVSYTHLDVYKRQNPDTAKRS